MPVWHPEMQSDADPAPGDAGVSSIPALGAPMEEHDMDVAAGEDDIIHRATDEVLLRSESASPEPDDHQVVLQEAGDAEGRPPVLGAGELIRISWKDEGLGMFVIRSCDHRCWLGGTSSLHGILEGLIIAPAY